MLELSAELFWLTLTVLLTSVLWVPYILSLIGQMGVGPALMDGEHDTPLESKAAQRMKRGHTNAVENLVVFAPLAIAIHVMGASTSLTAGACAVFFFARLAHFIIYALGLPLIRTIVFFVGWICQIILALALLGVV